MYTKKRRDHIAVSAAVRAEAEFKRKDFIYDPETGSYPCPAGNRLQLHGLNRTVRGLNWSYWADKKDCGACPMRQKCLSKHFPELE